jgi:hypothetical protein
MGYRLDAGFLRDKAVMLRDIMKGTHVYAIILQSVHMNCVIFIPI